jgi:type I restriction enzyme S subunit
MNNIVVYDHSWARNTLGNMVQFSQGVQVDVEGQVFEEQEGTVRFIRIVDYTQSTSDIRFIESSKAIKGIVKHEDIVMVRYGATGYVGRGIEGAIANNMFLITPEEIISKDYLYHYLTSVEIQEYIQSLVASSTMPALNFSAVSTIPFNYPDIAKQQKIAKILSTVDNLIEKTQTLIDKYTAIKQGMMADLFTRGIDMTTGDTPNSKGGKLRPSVEDAPELYKQTELGWVPKEWEVEKVETVARVVDSMHQTPIFSEHGFPMVRVTDIKGGAINLEGCAKVSASVYEQFIRQYEPKKGDVVLSRVGSYGVSSYADSEEKYCMGQNTVVITSNNDLSYLYLLFQANLIKNQFDLSIAGSSQKSLSLKSIKNTLIPIPSNEERLEITKRLDTLNSRLTIEKQFLLKMKNKKKGLMQDLLTGRVRVF